MTWAISVALMLVALGFGIIIGYVVARHQETIWREEALVRQRIYQRALDLLAKDKYAKRDAIWQATQEEGRRQ